ncbi:MAG: hypothetical protein ACRC1Y_02100 [Paraclostridium sp.]
MKNLVNWMCLICVMFLIVQVMIHISSEVIADVNKSNTSKNRKNKKVVSVGNTSIKKKVV